MADIYERLRERLDQFPQGFPRAESGVELEVLRHLFTPGEAELVLSLGVNAEAVRDIARRTGRDEKELGKKLYEMSKKGLIWRRKGPDEGKYLYAMVPWAFGVWEFQLNRLTKENARLYERFHEEAILPLRKVTKVAGFRVIPVEREIENRTEIQPFERVSQIIESNSRFAVAECICRKEAKLAGKGCDKMLEACMAFGPIADFYIENGLGREINREEARQVLAKAEESGLVHCAANHESTKTIICNCCSCCCKSIGILVKYGSLGGATRSNYYASHEAENCVACGTCVERCQAHAIQMEDGVTSINTEKCIGCGLCASTCPTGSITMVVRQPAQRLQVYATPKELMQAQAADRNRLRK